ncbi:MAG: DNA mismatch repair endonuclease MutL [Chthoniobacteraceae bacterium]|jgi:DNA mismatch repair protein MutL
MSRIALLSEEVASQVAAGEVIERPASVVKELVENSLDAGARKIEVMIRRGGNSMIRVADDGIGMDRDDALLCLERHATSKIRTGQDLAAISTLGFRGEALPSIASVSRFRLTTREHGALVGTEVAVNGGRIEYVRDGGEAPGTQIEARSLFYNLPARRKFLRTENTESSHVEHQLHLQAIGHPEVGFVLVNDERVVRQLPPAANLLERIRDLRSGALAAELLEVPDEEIGGIRLRGFIGKPGVSRSSRAQQLVFINGRAVENGTVNYALREGYHTALMKGQYPVTFLFLDMDPAAVDVNVHPAKREVRFRDPSDVRDLLVERIRRAIEGGRREWSGALGVKKEEEAVEARSLPAHGAVERELREPVVQSERELVPIEEQVVLRKDWAEMPVQPVAPPAAAATAQVKAKKDFRILGVLGRLYILMENADGLVLVDQHAAHERILFEELRRRMEAQGVPAQRLLMPVTMQLAPKDSDWVAQNLDTLQKMGIGIESFGPATWKIDALPQFLKGSDPGPLFREIIDELRETSAASSRMRLGEDVIATTVCRHAVKAHDVLREPEMVRLIQDLLDCELPYCCPHGRPTMIQISYGELEKKFGRRA